MSAARSITRRLGMCQVCGSQETLVGDTMPLHGYHRPDWMAVVGLCPGSGQPPIELHMDVALLALNAIEKRLVLLKDQALEQGAVLTLDRQHILAADFYDWIERFTLTRETWEDAPSEQRTKIREEYRRLRATLEVTRKEVRALEAHHHYISHQIMPSHGHTLRVESTQLALAQ